MGLMDNIKNAQDMAKQAQEAAAQQGGAAAAGAGAMPDAEDMETAQMMQRIGTNGIKGTAKIESISETGKTDPGGGKQFAIGVEVTKEGDDTPYKATFKQNLTQDGIDAYQPGVSCECRIDPQDPSQGVLWGMPA
jgi:hypothetical protein